MMTKAVHPVGARRCAERMTGLLYGAVVDSLDIEELARRGLLDQAGEYEGYPLFNLADIERCAAEHPDLVAEIVTARLDWMQVSTWPYKAQRRLEKALGWTWREFTWAVSQRGVTKGGQGRYAIADIDALEGDEDLHERILAARDKPPRRKASVANKPDRPRYEPGGPKIWVGGMDGHFERLFDRLRHFANPIRGDYTHYDDFLAAVMAEADRLVGGRDRADAEALADSARVAEAVAEWSWNNLTPGV